jgi:hypothetical protein
MLTGGASIGAIAEELGVDRTTLWRWRREPAFVAAVNSRRAELWNASRDKFRTLLPQAMDLLEQGIEGGDLRTALAVVKLAGLGDLGRVGPSDVEAILEDERERRSARERRRHAEERERAEDEVRELEHQQKLELRRLYAS